MKADRRLDDVARNQHGAFSLFQAKRAGLSYKQMRWRVAAGRWVELSSAVYGVASSPASFEQRVMAAILAHPRAIGAGESAARLHGFPGYRRGRVEIMVPLTGNARTRDAYVIRSTFFNTVHRTKVSGVEVTSPAETLLTLAGRVSRPRLEHLLDHVLGAGTDGFRRTERHR